MHPNEIKNISLISIKVNDETKCVFTKDEVTEAKDFSIQITNPSVLELLDWDGVSRKHLLSPETGWFHFGVYVHDDLSCHVNCAITPNETYDVAKDWYNEDVTAIRFQTFFISGSAYTNEQATKDGYFVRGLHEPNTTTNTKISYSGVCDYCKNSLRLKHYHTGWNWSEYFYSDSGIFTLDVSALYLDINISLKNYSAEKLAALEAMLPKAPDGSNFKYMNPLRCPACHSPLIFFQSPEDRSQNYRGYYLMENELLIYKPEKA